MYNREHVTMYLLSPELVVGFPCCPGTYPEVTRVVQIVSFLSIEIQQRCSRCPGGRAPTGEPETTRARARSKLNTKLKTHVLGVNHAGTAGSVRFMTLQRFLVDFSFSRHILLGESSSFRRSIGQTYIRVLTENSVRKEIHASVKLLVT